MTDPNAINFDLADLRRIKLDVRHGRSSATLEDAEDVTPWGDDVTQGWRQSIEEWAKKRVRGAAIGESVRLQGAHKGDPQRTAPADLGILPTRRGRGDRRQNPDR